MRPARTSVLIAPLCFAALSGCVSPALVGDTPTRGDAPRSGDASSDEGGDVAFETAADASGDAGSDVLGELVDASDASDVSDASDGCAVGATERCDGVDNDCDGLIDEGFCRVGGVCYADGEVNAANRCQRCVAPVTQRGATAWSVAVGTICRPSAGVCDLAEVCTSAGECPVDALVAASTVCRASAGACDVAETCTGSSAACPADQLARGGATTYVRSPSPLSFIDACGAAGMSRFLGGVDDGSRGVAMPFSFRYYGAAQSAVWVGINGDLSFSAGPALSEYVNQRLPYAPLADTIFAFWDDLFTRASGICVATVGAAPDRRFVVEWRDAHFCCTDDPGVHMDFEVVLSESGDTVDVLYDRMESPDGRSSGASATIGIQNVDGSAFDLVGADVSGTAVAGRGFRWTPRGPVVCRPSAGPCDAAEVCSGSSAACPDDARSPATSACRPVVSPCDVAETCTGSSAACPADAFVPDGTSCGASTCAAGACCRSGSAPSVEVCNNLDDDCNGLVDDGLVRGCYTGPSGTAGQGMCRAGLQACAAGVWGACAGEVRPAVEVCDGRDNNCNNAVDEGLTCP